MDEDGNEERLDNFTWRVTDTGHLVNILGNYNKVGLFGFDFAHKVPVDKRNPKVDFNLHFIPISVHLISLRMHRSLLFDSKSWKMEIESNFAC